MSLKQMRGGLQRYAFFFHFYFFQAWRFQPYILHVFLWDCLFRANKHSLMSPHAVGKLLYCLDGIHENSARTQQPNMSICAVKQQTGFSWFIYHLLSATEQTTKVKTLFIWFDFNERCKELRNFECLQSHYCLFCLLKHRISPLKGTCKSNFPGGWWMHLMATWM